MGKSGETCGMAADKSQKQKNRWSMKQGRKAINLILRHWWTFVISRILSWSKKFKSTKAELYSEVKDDSGSYAVKDHQHLKWQPQKSWTLLQDYQEVQDKQQTQYPLTPESKWKIHQRYWKFWSRNVQTFRYVYQSTNGRNRGPAWKTQSFLLNGICTIIR